jgi:hypothetical protein
MAAASEATPRLLLLLPCHAVYRGGLPEGHAAERRSEAALRSDASWELLPFQRGEATVFVDHIQAALAELRRDPNATLVVSGGTTRAVGGRAPWGPGSIGVTSPFPSSPALHQAVAQRSEAHSYWLAALDLAADPAEAAHLSASLAQGRILLEAAARDSCENLAFSLALYRQQQGSLPSKLTVRAHGMAGPSCLPNPLFPGTSSLFPNPPPPVNLAPFLWAGARR